MDLSFSAEELAFRDELRGFIAENLPDDIRRKMRLGHLGPLPFATPLPTLPRERARVGRGRAKRRIAPVGAAEQAKFH